jgi:hypothetical protein
VTFPHAGPGQSDSASLRFSARIVPRRRTEEPTFGHTAADVHAARPNQPWCRDEDWAVVIESSAVQLIGGRPTIRVFEPVTRASALAFSTARAASA